MEYEDTDASGDDIYNYYYVTYNYFRDVTAGELGSGGIRLAANWGYSV